jgi:HK97 family phage major capsid protein
MPALDQTAGSNMYGGVVVYPIGEGDTLTETSAKLREVTLTPHQFGAFTVLTNKLLMNWAAAGAFIETQLRRAMIAYEDTQFYKGNGVAKPKGILSQPAKIVVTRGTANTIVSGDIDSMYARMKFGGSLVWIASQTILPQLVTLKNSNNWNLFAVDYTKPVPTTLLGIPILFNDRSVALGTTGDLILVDLSYYLIKDGSGPYVDVSEHLYFTSAKTVVRIIWATDGDSWLTEALPLEGSTANTVSPFVVLGSA